MGTRCRIPLAQCVRRVVEATYYRFRVIRLVRNTRGNRADPSEMQRSQMGGNAAAGATARKPDGTSPTRTLRPSRRRSDVIGSGCHARRPVGKDIKDWNASVSTVFNIATTFAKRRTSDPLGAPAQGSRAASFP